MKFTYITIFCLLLTINTVLGQTVNITATPESSCNGSPVTLTANTSSCNDYTNSTISFSPQSLTGAATTVSLGDDQTSGALPIGFAFNFYCNDYSNFYISSNGFITFSSGQSSGCCTGPSLPSSNGPNNLIAFAWEDLDPGNGGQPSQNLIRYETIGSAPNRILIVDFFAVDHYPNNNNVTVQTLLYEGSNNIEIHTTNMPSDGGNHTMGLENEDGTIAHVASGRNGSNWSASNEGIRFEQIQCNNTSIDWQSPLGTSIGTGNSIVVNPTSTTTYYAVSNSSCGLANNDKIVEVKTVDAGPDLYSGGGSVNMNVDHSYPTTCDDYNVSNISFSPRSFTGNETTVSLSDDQTSASLPIGFTFNFYCNDYSNFKISSNGFITFNSSSSSGCCSGQSLPHSSTPNNLIAFAWEDLDPGNSGQPSQNLIRYETIGNAPNRILIVEFFNVDHYPNNNNVTVQTLLYESSNTIEIHTTDMPSDGGNHTMGIEDANGQNALTVSGRNASNWSASNEGIRFEQTSSINVTWTPATWLSSTSQLNPVASPNVTTDYTIEIDDGSGCVLTDVVRVFTTWDPLPIELLSFEGNCRGDQMEFNWTTASEINNDFFTIERLNEVTNSWEKVKTVSGAGNSSSLQQYSTAVNNVENGYFRLTQTDYDGTTESFDIVSVNCDRDLKMVIFPNPAHESVQLILTNRNEEPIKCSIYNSTGSVVLEQSIKDDHTQLDLSKLQPGIYTVSVIRQHDSFFEKLIIN